VRLTWDGSEMYALAGDDGVVTLSKSPPTSLTLSARDVLGDPNDVRGVLLRAPGDSGLAALREHPETAIMAGSVRLAYLDPPYNTGRSFKAYRDRTDREAWLILLRQTLASVRSSLRDDGCVWIHLDDHEVHRARLVADEVFGEEQFVADVIWERKRKPSFLHAQIAQVTDHMLVYARDRSRLPKFVSDDGRAPVVRKIPIHHPGNIERELTFAPGTVTFALDDQTIPSGDMSTKAVASKLLDDLVIVHGVNATTMRLFGPFRFTQQRLDAELSSGQQIHVPRLPLRPHLLRRSGPGGITTLFTRATGMATNEAAKEHSRALFDVGFDTPKPEELLERIITACTDPGDVVLDVFAGSGTTAAVAHKLGRSWIAIEVSSEVLDKFTVPRLRAVVDGADAGGITKRTTLSPRYRMPDAMTTRDARRAGEWVSGIADQGAFDDLDPHVVAEMVRRIRTETTAQEVVELWSGGGGFRVLTAEVPGHA